MMINYDDALQQVLDTVFPLPPIVVPLADAAGLILTSPATAQWDMPRFDNAAMDGFAIADLPENHEIGLPLIGASYAGHPYPEELLTGEAIRITTGAVLPRGARTVVPLEEAKEDEGCIFLSTEPKVGQHVRLKGEEFRLNDVLVDAGSMLRAGDIALLASAGVTDVKVCPRPRVAIMSTGDELVELGQIPGPGQTINSNLHYLRVRLTECGYTPICVGVGEDDPEILDQLFDQALGADIIISSGGVSIGEKDLIQSVLDNRDFKKKFWKVAIKPGKPVLFGMLDGRPYIGLPGNPAATATTFELFVKPALKRLAGQVNPLPVRRKAILANDISGGGNRQTFLWCKLEWQENGYKVTVSQHQGSGQNRCLSETNAILPVSIGIKRLVEGEVVDVITIAD